MARLARLWVLEREGENPREVDPGVVVEWTSAHVSRVGFLVRDPAAHPGTVALRHLVHEGVVEVIEREGLYRD